MRIRANPETDIKLRIGKAGGGRTTVCLATDDERGEATALGELSASLQPLARIDASEHYARWNTKRLLLEVNFYLPPFR